MRRKNISLKRKLGQSLALFTIIASIAQNNLHYVYATVDDQSGITLYSENSTEEEITPTPTDTPDTSTPNPTLVPEVLTPSPTVAPEVPSPAPGVPTTTPIYVTPKPSVAPTPTPEPTQIPYRSKTLEGMSKYDYIAESVTGVSTVKDSLASLQSRMKNYGRLYGVGMPYKEYESAMSNVWEDATQYDRKPSKITVDINQTMNYNTYVNTLKKLSRYEGVYLYKIGKSTEGRDLYAIEIDMDSEVDKNVYMLTGQIHAREFAGGTFSVKQLVDLVQKAQTDQKTMEMLKKNKFVAVPIINVDGREAIINSSKKWTTKGGQLWKAYTNGTDGGRNFPGLLWGQITIGNSLRSIIENKPGYANYPGSYAGSNSETKAMMKWLYHYVVVEQADLYLDLHQQGAIVYAGKRWQTKSGEQRSKDLRKNVLSVLNNTKYRRKYTNVSDSNSYGLRGEGSSLTDYAVGLSVGAKFSPAFGFAAFTDGKKEYMLLEVKNLDISKIKFKPANKNFAAITLEIGYGRSYLGNSSSTRSLLAKEYTNYNFGKLLEALPKMVK